MKQPLGDKIREAIWSEKIAWLVDPVLLFLYTIVRLLRFIFKFVWKKIKQIFKFLECLFQLGLCAVATIIFLFISLFTKNEVPKKDGISVSGAGVIILAIIAGVIGLLSTALAAVVLGTVFLILFSVKEKLTR
jgi:hypothetical protein